MSQTCLRPWTQSYCQCLLLRRCANKQMSRPAQMLKVVTALRRNVKKGGDKTNIKNSYLWNQSQYLCPQFYWSCRDILLSTGLIKRYRQKLVGFKHSALFVFKPSQPKPGILFFFKNKNKNNNNVMSDYNSSSNRSGSFTMY